MNPRSLVRPLEDDWLPVLDAVLRQRKAPLIGDVARLAPKVGELSKAYNGGQAGDSASGARLRLPVEARIGFSFARDVPKGAGAVRELVARGALQIPADRPLVVVDLGAGLGAMTWGVVRALEAAGQAGVVEALLVDDDDEVLAAAQAIAKAASALPARRVELRVTTRKGRVGPGLRVPPADLVILGQVLSELDLAMDSPARVVHHVATLTELGTTALRSGGSLVVVEPALRERTRHLHAIRDALLARPELTVFAPCLHVDRCPALAEPGEWCHDDLPLDLPTWIVPLARAAGLRWQRLTFSYLVLRSNPVGAPVHAGRASLLGRELPPDDRAHVRLRVISEVMRTKGKSEIFGCTHDGNRVRLRRLDREATEASAAWEEMGRGDIVALGVTDPEHGAPFDARGRTSPHLSVDVWPFRK